MQHAIVWLRFWGFMGCVAIAIGMANLHPLPSDHEINSSARKEVAIALTRRGDSPKVIQCVLDPPALLWNRSCEEAFRTK